MPKLCEGRSKLKGAITEQFALTLWMCYTLYTCHHDQQHCQAINDHFYLPPPSSAQLLQQQLLRRGNSTQFHASWLAGLI
eukprot:1160368-Pelagomonas_calceolata.AAC.4